MERLPFFLAVRSQVVKKALKIRAYLPEFTSIIPRHMVQFCFYSFRDGEEAPCPSLCRS